MKPELEDLDHWFWYIHTNHMGDGRVVDDRAVLYLKFVVIGRTFTYLLSVFYSDLC